MATRSAPQRCPLSPGSPGVSRLWAIAPRSPSHRSPVKLLGWRKYAVKKVVSNEQRLPNRLKPTDARGTPKSSAIVTAACRHFTIPYSASTIHQVPPHDTTRKQRTRKTNPFETDASKREVRMRKQKAASAPGSDLGVSPPPFVASWLRGWSFPWETSDAIM
jgi:hypothetical protein